MVAGIVILIVVLSDKKKKEQYQLNSQQPVTPMNQPAASINHSAASIKQSMASMKKPMVYAMSPQLQGMKKELSERPILLVGQKRNVRSYSRKVHLVSAEDIVHFPGMRFQETLF